MMKNITHEREQILKLKEEKAYLEKKLKELKQKLEEPKGTRFVEIPLEEYEQLIRENERMKTVIESARIIHNLRGEGDD